MSKHFYLIGLWAILNLLPQYSFGQQNSGAEQLPDSINTILTTAKRGDAVAQNEVGAWYYQGKFVEQNYAEALQWWARSAKQGHIQAIGNMGLCYQKGHGIERDSLKAIQLYSKSVKEGNKALFLQNAKLADNKDIFASVFMGYCYQKGIGTQKDAGKALAYYTQAAKLNSVDAQRELALCYLNGKKPAEAAPWFKCAAENGDLSSTFYYGKLLYEGKGIATDKQQGVIYLLKAAEANFPQAQYEVAKCYASGEGITKNAEQAARWYKKAAANGVSNAQYSLALCYINGEGTERNYDEAIYWLGEAAPKGHTRAFKKTCEEGWNDTPFLAYLQGMHYYIVAKNYEPAIKCFKEVEKAKCIEGKTMQGVCLLNKDYKKYNVKKGVKTLEEAARTHPMAMYLLGVMYEAGKGVDKDINQAISFLEKAADKGYATAQCYLGNMYYEGRGVMQDYEKAVAYYMKAKTQGQLTANAAKRLASCYENGWGGLEADKKKANALLKEEHKNNTADLLKLVPMQ